MKRISRNICVIVLAVILLSLPILVACGDEGTPGSTSTPVSESKPSSAPIADNLVTYTEEREPCECRSEYRNVYWGELHAHTTLSYDAYTWGTITTPDQAYRFAKGEEIALLSLHSNENEMQYVKLSRPLDFAALTDHQEYLSETYLCKNPDSGAYDCELCQKMREGGTMNLLELSLNLREEPPSHIEEICQAPGVDCYEISKNIWETIVQNAEDAYDRTSSCTFTTFPAYEFTLSPHMSNKHRNIIFRNAEVPGLPPSSFEQSHQYGLWEELMESCLEKGNNCDYIAIPHASNWSNGHMFMPDYPIDMSLEEQSEVAANRAEIESLVEITQHKGSMECKNGFEGNPDDPLCDFEKIREVDFPDCEDIPGDHGMVGAGCLSRYDYIRNVLKLGLSEWLRLGVNPYKLGIIGATDTHNGIPSKVEEYDFPGHMGMLDNSPQDRLNSPPFELYNPGAITAVWAVENSRDAIFEAFQRRETYSTTGPRISVRFFGGWEYSDDIIEKEDFIAVGYEKGVPMGSDLPTNSDLANAPTFAVMATKDPGVEGHPGTDLQQIQIIKGWIDSDGNEREKVFVVAGDPDNGAGVDMDTCQPIGEGSEQLSTVWTDPEFDPNLPAFYYMRVVENPSCRWIQYDCNEFSDGNMPETCSNSVIRKTVQERAITSPIWYEPQV